MKICYLTHDMLNHTGCGVFSKSFIEKVKEARPEWDISVIAEVKTDHPLEKAVLRMDKKGIFLNFFKIRAHLKDCDIIHAVDAFPYGLAAILCSFGFRKRIFMTAIGSGSIGVLTQIFYSRFIKRIYRRADEFTAISNYTAKRIKNEIPDLKIKVINLGVGLNLFEKRETDQNLKKEILDKKPYLLSDGALKSRKGYEYSIPAFAKVSKRLPELKYVIIRSKTDRGYDYVEKIENIIKSLGLEDKVFFFYNISDDLRRVIYNNAELFFLMPQEGLRDVEGFGLVFLQAAASGLPVVTSKGSAPEDAILDGKNGFLVSPKDTNAISEAIVKILEDNNLREKFSEESRKFAKYMSWDKTAGQYIDLYEKYLKETDNEN